MLTISLECFVPRAAEARAHACLGLVYELMKDTDRAIDHHQKVTAIWHAYKYIYVFNVICHLKGMSCIKVGSG